MNRIEEVENMKGMYLSDRCRFCHEMGEKVEPFLCEDCRQKIFDWVNSKGWTIHQFPQPLDDKELREKLAQWLYRRDHSYDSWLTASPKLQEGYGKSADQALALLPSIEEATAEKCTVAFDTGLSMGKREERARIFHVMNVRRLYILTRDCKNPNSEDWQALSGKGGE